jgi:predicted RNase H-like nuclease (RuvC/YqgF family)
VTGDEYEEEIASLRRSGEVFRSTVVEALNRTIESLDHENAELKDRLHEEEFFDNLKQERNTSGILAANMQAQVSELERELRIVRRDRDALIRRAESAEKTLLKSGFDLHTMQSGPIVGPAGTGNFPGVAGRGFQGGTIP